MFHPGQALGLYQRVKRPVVGGFGEVRTFGNSKRGGRAREHRGTGCGFPFARDASP